jgi:hypothetical protein
MSETPISKQPRGYLDMSDIKFTLSSLSSETVHEFSDAKSAGAAFASANAAFRPRVILSGANGARMIARTVQTGDRIGKSAPTPESVQVNFTGIDKEFWEAYHDRLANIKPTQPGARLS